jgi:hypothetical protein
MDKVQKLSSNQNYFCVVLYCLLNSCDRDFLEKLRVAHLTRFSCSYERTCISEFPTGGSSTFLSQTNPWLELIEMEGKTVPVAEQIRAMDDGRWMKSKLIDLNESSHHTLFLGALHWKARDRILVEATIFVCTPQCPDGLRAKLRMISLRQSAWSEADLSPHLAPYLRNGGAMHPLPHTPLLQNRTNSVAFSPQANKTD